MTLWRLIPLWFLFSCTSGIQNQRIHIADSGWSEDDSLSFNFIVKDTSKIFDFNISAVIADTFPFQNLYLKGIVMSSEKIISDTIFSLEFYDHMGVPVNSTNLKGIQGVDSEFLKLILIQYSREPNVTGIREVKVQLSTR